MDIWISVAVLAIALAALLLARIVAMLMNDHRERRRTRTILLTQPMLSHSVADFYELALIERFERELASCGFKPVPDSSHWQFVYDGQLAISAVTVDNRDLKISYVPNVPDTVRRLVSRAMKAV